MVKSIMIVEWMVGGGQFLASANSVASDFSSSLAHEGQQMLVAMIEEMVAIGLEPVVPVDSRFTLAPVLGARLVPVENGVNFLACVRDLAQQADKILLIAPESQARLERLCEHVDSQKEKLISPNLEFIRLASDKSATAERLNQHGVQVPVGVRAEQWLATHSLSDFRLPAIVKPNDGAGSEGIIRVDDWSTFDFDLRTGEQWRLEVFVDGRAASVSVICSEDGKGHFCCPPTWQIFEQGTWAGCELVVDAGLSRRAKNLAMATIAALPATRGYVGIDMVLGNEAAEDFVIEVNPRLTSSFLKLREWVGSNIASRMFE
jgi:predicted ATP-grasp superfamily ATP-dependent carboligase